MKLNHDPQQKKKKKLVNIQSWKVGELITKQQKQQWQQMKMRNQEAHLPRLLWPTGRKLEKTTAFNQGIKGSSEVPVLGNLGTIYKDWAQTDLGRDDVKLMARTEAPTKPHPENSST